MECHDSASRRMRRPRAARHAVRLGPGAIALLIAGLSAGAAAGGMPGTETSCRLAPCVGSANPQEERFGRPGDAQVSLHFAGRDRSAIVHLPPDFRALGPLPALVAFHGGGGNAKGFQEYAGLDSLADENGFVVVYPNGIGRWGGRLLTWNAGGCCGYAQREGVDDVAFTWALLANLAADLPLDRTRVYLTGHSNGSMMVYRIAAESAERVAAVAAVAGAMTLESFAPTAPVPVLHIHSVDDPRALYQGGLGPPFPFTRYRVEHRAVETELGRWVRRNGWRQEPHQLETRAEESHDPPHRAALLSYEPCTTGMPVRLWRLQGPGHGWPGGHSSLPERIVGPATTVIDAATEVWHFVSRFQRQEAPPLR